MVLLKMLVEIGLRKMRGLLVMTMASISPSGREVPLAESLRWRAKVLLPKFRLEAAGLRPGSPLLIFIGQNDLYTRRWALEVGRAEHNPPWRAWRGAKEYSQVLAVELSIQPHLDNLISAANYLVAK